MNAHQRRVFGRALERVVLRTIRTDPHFGVKNCDAVLVRDGKAYVIRRTKPQLPLYHSDYVGGTVFAPEDSREREIHEESHYIK